MGQGDGHVGHEKGSQVSLILRVVTLTKNPNPRSRLKWYVDVTLVTQVSRGLGRVVDENYIHDDESKTDILTSAGEEEYTDLDKNTLLV